MKSKLNQALTVTVMLASLAMPPAASWAGDANAEAEAAYKDIQATLGGVPDFAKAFPKAGIAGAWAEVKALEMSGDTALPSKVKSLISLAVSAQIPCQYCIYADTANAKAAGATVEEIREAIAMAALTRHWSTVLYGNQIDFETFKKQVTGN